MDETLSVSLIHWIILVKTREVLGLPLNILVKHLIYIYIFKSLFETYQLYSDLLTSLFRHSLRLFQHNRFRQFFECDLNELKMKLERKK